MLLKLTSPFARFAKKPRNYRGSLPYVNLEAPDPAVGMVILSNFNNLNIGPTRQCLDTLFDLMLIPFFSNNFGS